MLKKKWVFHFGTFWVVFFTALFFVCFQQSPQSISECFHHPQKKPCSHQQSLCILSQHPQFLANTNLFSLLGLPIPGISYKWNQTIRGLL